MTIAPELIERFRTDLGALLPVGDTKLGIAYSGGPDSLALLLMAHAAYPDQVKAATVDHGLRQESWEEARTAAENCRQLGVPHEVLKVEVASGNLQSEARRARYAALADWAETRGIETILTAHHADDQAETFLMRANRGSGFAGLAGVRPDGIIPDTEIRLARPLLGWRRTTLEEIARGSSFKSVDDPSNLDQRFDRVRIRKALNEIDFINVDGLARSAALLAEMEADFDGLVLEERNRAIEEHGAPSRYRPFARSQVYRPVIWGGAVRMLVSDLGSTLTSKEAALMVSELLAGRPVNIGGIQARTQKAGEEMVWTFARENPRRTG